MKRSKARILCFLFALVSWISVDALAQRIIVPFPPGGASDILARALASEPAMNRRYVVDNRGGAAGVIGTQLASAQPGDGSVLLVVTVVDISAPLLAALVDFVPLAYLGGYTHPRTGNKFGFGIFGPPSMSRETARTLEGVIRSALRGDEFVRQAGQLTGWAQDRDTSSASLAQLISEARRPSTAQAADDPKVVGGAYRR